MSPNLEYTITEITTEPTAWREKATTYTYAQLLGDFGTESIIGQLVLRVQKRDAEIRQLQERLAVVPQQKANLSWE